MYCDRCGTQLGAGAQFCSQCGKAIVGGVSGRNVAASQDMGQTSGSTGAYGAAAGARSEGRVQRHVRTLAMLWAINGVLRLMGVAWMMIFGTMFFPFMRGWGRGMVWPLGGRWGLDVPFMGGLFSVGVFLGLFGVLHLVLAWGLFERQPWARMLGLVIAFLALLRFPLGTALGIYTLWVLLPEDSGREYDRLAQGDGRMNSATVS
jgi:hypothetical protein